MRRTLARRMHNELSQKTTVLAFELALLNGDIEKKSKSRALRQKSKELCDLVDELSRAIRSITSEIHPKVLDEFGLAAALQSFVQSIEKEVPCSLQCQEVTLPSDIASGLFSIARATANLIFIPWKVTKLEIQLETVRGMVRLRLSGNHDKLSAKASHNLDWLLIEERASRIGATLKYITVPGMGTTLSVSVPLKENAGSHAKEKF
jgi:signal transduction histidine kinase